MVSNLPNTDFVRDIVFETNIYEPTHGTTNAMIDAAGKAATQVATLIPPSVTLEDAMVTSTLHAFVNKGIDTVNTPAVKTGLMGIAILIAGGVVYYGGKYICDKIFGDNKKFQLENSPINENSEINITYNNGTTAKLSGDKISGSLDYRNISKIEIQ
jgi:hypothetical protein